MISNNYCSSDQSSTVVLIRGTQRIQDPTSGVLFSEAETLRVSTRDAKLVLRASLEMGTLDKASVGWIAVIPWMSLRAAILTSSKSIM